MEDLGAQCEVCLEPEGGSLSCDSLKGYLSAGQVLGPLLPQLLQEKAERLQEDLLVPAQGMTGEVRMVRGDEGMLVGLLLGRDLRMAPVPGLKDPALNPHPVLGEDSGLEELVDAVDRQVARVAGGELGGHWHLGEGVERREKIKK